MELVHCRRRSQNVRFDLNHRGGLLYTETLIQPGKADRTNKKPVYILHADVVMSDSNDPLCEDSCTLDTCSCTTCGSKSLSSDQFIKEVQTRQQLGFQPDADLKKMMDFSDSSDPDGPDHEAVPTTKFPMLTTTDTTLKPKPSLMTCSTPAPKASPLSLNKLDPSDDSSSRRPQVPAPSAIL